MPVAEFAFSYNRFIQLLTVPLLAGPRHSSVSLSDDEMIVRMGLGGWTFSADIPLAAITRASPTTGRVLSWGAHGWRGRWLVNGSSVGMVKLDIDPRAHGRCVGFPLRIRELTMSLEDPDGFIRAITPAVGR
ncbi:MAG: hypothetical protein ABI949_14455 [Ilumatobacteraceae bacterium]